MALRPNFLSTLFEAFLSFVGCSSLSWCWQSSELGILKDFMLLLTVAEVVTFLCLSFVF